MVPFHRGMSSMPAPHLGESTIINQFQTVARRGTCWGGNMNAFNISRSSRGFERIAWLCEAGNHPAPGLVPGVRPTFGPKVELVCQLLAPRGVLTHEGRA